MLTASLRLVYRLPDASSLKDKRRVRQRIQDRVRARFDVAINEVDDQEEHRRLVFGVAAVGNDARVLESVLDKVIHFVDELYVAERVAADRQISGFFPTGS